MEFLKNNARGIIISLLVAGAIIGIASISDDNTDTNNEQQASQNENTENTDNTESNDGSEGSGENAGDASTDENSENDSERVRSDDNGFVSTTAQGDNQTVVVRRIVENYLAGSEVELSAEQKLYVETNLVNDLGRSDFVAVGEEIALPVSTVAQRVEEAQNLSDAAISRWSQYL